MKQTRIHLWVRGHFQSPAVRADAGRPLGLVRHLLVLASLWVSVLGAQAAQVVVGQVAPFTGAQSSQAREYAVGMQTLFTSVNKAGGVNGHTFRLVTRDDHGKAAETLKLTRELIDQSQAMVLAGYFGGASISSLVDAGLLEKERIAIVGYRSEDIRAETPQLYNVRASLQDEVAKITEHLATVGITQLGLLYEGGPDAVAYLAAIQDLARRGGGTIVSTVSYESGTARVGDAVASFVKTRPQAIIMLSGAAASSAFIEQYRGAGGAAQLLVYSGADMERVIKRMAEKRSDLANAAKGVAVVQVVPSPYQNSRLVRELTDALATQGSTELTPTCVMLEGFIAAKAIVEAVRRQGRRPSREGMSVALDAIESLDLRGHVLSYKAGTRSGSRYVELTIITDTGKIRH